MSVARALGLALGLLASAGPAQAQARPQLDEAEAARHRVADYLAQGPAPWQPLAPAELDATRPDFIVAADGSGSHRAVQAAIDAVPARSAQAGDPASAAPRRWVVLIRPGTYRGPLCVRDKAPLLLIGEGDDAAAVRLVDSRYNAQPKPRGQAPQPCVDDEGARAADRHGTAGSTSVAVLGDDVVLARFTIANDAMDAAGGADGEQGHPPGASPRGGAQAVALTTAGDRIQLQHMRLIGHQDTLYLRTRHPGAPARVFVHDSLVAGDVDFIFGDATAVISHSTVLSRAGRRAPGQCGPVLAPSTAPGTRLGFLVTDSRFVGEPGLAPGSCPLGRAWDQGVPPGQWQLGASPNGQALVRDSVLGPHLGPWAASTARRPFSAIGAAANRLAEYRNSAGP